MTGLSINNIKKHLKQILIICISGAVVVSCANMASPSGGDYDFDPPKIIKITPEPNSLNTTSKRLEIIFDELVQIEKPMEKVIVTPPQKNFPVIKAQNNKVVVEIRDTLKPNTTYTIDFTDAIVDNNEKNPLENFAVSFSTGDIIDTLSISGKVLSANDLEPVSGMYVGIHSDLSDTAFTKTPFLRISRTNELGKFSIKGIAPGTYKLYALNDLNRDYMYDNPTEAIAFMDSVIIPTSVPAIRYDSIFDKNFIFDTLKEVSYTRFLPDDIVLRSFTSPFKRQYLQKHERLTDDVITIYFGAPTQMPEIEALEVPVDISEWSTLEKTTGNDTLKYWITKPAISQMDTIKLKVSYFMTDTLNQLQPVTDTLNFINRHKRREDKKDDDKKKKDKDKEQIRFLSITNNIKQEYDIYRDINLEFEFPVDDFEKEKLHLQKVVDSTFTDLDFIVLNDSLNPRKYRLSYKWQHDEKYRLSIDSAAFHSYNGLWNNKVNTTFQIKSFDKYGSQMFNLTGLPQGIPAFVELLDKSGNGLRKETVKNNTVLFQYIDPGVYYARIIIDTNGNGVWDTGDFTEKREPEQVYYYNKSFETKAFWDITEDWDITAIPTDKQKPLDITKNKPKDKDKKKREMQRRDSRDQQSRNNSSNQNTGRNRNTTGNSTYNQSTY